MDRQVIILFWLLILVGLTPANAQLDSVLIQKGIMQLCPKLSYLSDSVANRKSLDSTAMLMRGRWSLQIIEGSWATARKPEKAVELIFDRQGRGDIYEDGQLCSSIQLVIRRVYAMVRFDVRQEGKSIISLSISKRNGGHLGVCEEKLFLSAGGMLYAFRRIH
ncbi:hypothetical protein A6C57_26780 (plasmid) [Fibrella sp. ES10-3-2-2]